MRGTLARVRPYTCSKRPGLKLLKSLVGQMQLSHFELVITICYIVRIVLFLITAVHDSQIRSMQMASIYQSTRAIITAVLI